MAENYVLGEKTSLESSVESSHDTIDGKVENEIELMLSNDEINRIKNPWASSLIVKIHGNVGEDFPYQQSSVSESLKATWRPTGEMKCMSLSHGFLLITLSLEEDLIRVSRESPMFIGDNIVTVRKWEPNFIPSKAAHNSTNAPAWVRLPELPIEYYDMVVLEKIGNRIGHLLRIDSRTAAGEYGKFARLCIHVDLQKPLPRSIKIGPLQQSIEYEGMDSTTCGHLVGHKETICLIDPNLKHLSDPITEHETPPLSLLDKPHSEVVVEKRPLISSMQSMLPLLVRQATIKWKYEVFVSFRGDDLRSGFASHLFQALQRADILHYRDTNQEERGLEVKPMLIDAIHYSKVVLVLFSTNYADSRWCLDELVEIMKCHNKYKEGYGHRVFPIFYHVEPSDVRAQRGVFGDGFLKCIEKNGNQKAAEWREALDQVGNLSGWALKNKEESELIDKIVETICNRISMARSPYGGDGGTPYDDNMYTGIRKMTIIVASSTVESITIEYDQNGSLICSRRYGGPRKDETFTVRLNYPMEYLTSISGHIRGNSINGVIQSILLQSNEREYGPYGKQEGRQFSIDPKKGEMIVGFYGRCGSHLNSIAAYRKPTSSTLDNNIGPFGSNDKVTWDDGKHQDIRHIQVVFDSMVRSINIVYDNYGHPVGPFVHGDENFIGEKKLVKLEYPYEYVTSISGFIRESSDGVTLQSLTIHTNMNNHGPFGTQVGNHFSATQRGIKILGFYGRCSNGNFESIGAHFESTSHIHPHKSIQAFGGEGGNPWDDGMHNNMRKIVVEWGGCIDAVWFTYDQEEEQGVETLRHGGPGGSRIHEVNLDPDEYITGVSGYYGKHNNEDVIKSLTFESNKRKLGPYGSNQEGTYFMSPQNHGKVVGFYGSSSWYVVSIGAYFAPIFHKHPLTKIGPFGGDGGGSWDDGRHTDIRRIDIRYGLVIHGIGCIYADDGRPSIEVAHRGGTEGNSHTVELDYPKEYVVSMSGYVGRYGNSTLLLVMSLTFRTNYNKKHGPFGTEEGMPFSFASNIGKIVGFHGRSGIYLDSIGAHVEILAGQGSSKDIE